MTGVLPLPSKYGNDDFEELKKLFDNRAIGLDQLIKGLEKQGMLKNVVANKVTPKFAPPGVAGMPSVMPSGMQAGSMPHKREPRMPSKDELMRVLGIRLRLPEGYLFPLHIDFCVKPEKVYVFVVSDNGATIIEDDPTLFPSDALITAIKLLEG